MDTLCEMISRGVEQLLGRANGPLQFRLVVMPIVVTGLALRAGLRDFRTGEPPFLWAVVTDPAQRRKRLLEGWRDVTRIFIMAVVLDTVYQVIVLQAFYVVQTLIVAIACAILPYMVFRSLTTRLARSLSWKRAERTRGMPPAKTREFSEERNAIVHPDDRECDGTDHR